MRRDAGYNAACLPTGAHVAVHLPDGQIWFGRCKFAMPDAIAVQPWGTGECRRFAVTPGMTAQVIEPCPYEAAVVITRRQRAGQPGGIDTTHASEVARQAEREQRKTAEHQAQKLARVQARIQARKNRAEGNQHDEA